jgi:hypothetical protein
VGSGAEELGNQRRHDDKKSSMGKSVDDGKHEEHPQPIRQQQPAQTDTQETIADGQGPFVSDAVAGKAHDNPADNAQPPDGGQHAGGPVGGDAQVDGMGYNVQQHREHADQQEKVCRTDQPQLQILQRLPQGKSFFSGLGDLGSHAAVTVGAQAAPGRIAHQQLGQSDERDQHHDTHDKKRRPPAKGRDEPVGKQRHDQHAHAGSHLETPLMRPLKRTNQRAMVDSSTTSVPLMPIPTSRL